MWGAEKRNGRCICSSSDKFSQDNLLLDFRIFRAQIYAFMPIVLFLALNLKSSNLYLTVLSP